jgi:hypothetical protein
MEEQPRTPGSPSVVQEPEDVVDTAAADVHEQRAAPAGTIAGVWAFVALIGLWMLFTPVLLEYGAGDSAANAIIVGALALTIALCGITRLVPGRVLGGACLLLGIWLVASAGFLADSSNVRVDSVLMGGALVVLAIVSMSALADRGHATR